MSGASRRPPDLSSQFRSPPPDRRFATLVARPKDVDFGSETNRTPRTAYRVLIDYLNGEDDTRGYLERNPNAAYYGCSHTFFELYDGLKDDEFAIVEDALDWVTPIPFNEKSVREAVRIERELESDGSPINLKDVFIAGGVREAGGTTVTRDGHFGHIDGLSVEPY